jgi:hypothetical protein
MSTLEETLEQLIARKRNSGLNPSPAKSEFDRLAAIHFTSEVLPEVRIFERDLRPQGVNINLVSATQPSLVGTLMIESPESVYNSLKISYDFPMRSLVLESSFGSNDWETIAKFSTAQFREVTRAKVYEFIQEFVTGVFSADTLCEFDDDDNELLDA